MCFDISQTIVLFHFHKIYKLQKLNVPFWVMKKEGIKELKQIFYAFHNKDLKENLHH
jgi:hypothetical protein